MRKETFFMYYVLRITHHVLTYMTELGKSYDSFRDRMLKWSRRWFGNFGEAAMLYLFLLPDLVRLMVNLLADTRVFIVDKFFIAGVLIYIISPIDIFPEILIGPFGLVEDLILALIVLYRFLSNPSNNEAIWANWKGDPQVMAKLQQWFQSLRMLMHKRK
jgi:uncharacterized membrane protein YkvA (DUF1232 family)